MAEITAKLIGEPREKTGLLIAEQKRLQSLMLRNLLKFSERNI